MQWSGDARGQLFDCMPPLPCQVLALRNAINTCICNALQLVLTRNKFRIIKSLQHVSEALQYDVASSCSILIFAISLFGCALALDARGRRPACPPTPLHAPALRSRG